MQYPLTLSFKILTLVSQLSVNDATGALVLYVRQKFFKIKEAITVYADAEQTQPLYYINADRILDISARYTITDAQGNEVGAVKRHGLRSFIKSHYEIEWEGRPVVTVREEKGWVKVLDALLGEVPILGLFTGYFFHPAYLVTRGVEGAEGDVVMRLEKQPAFLEGKFTIENHQPLHPIEERVIILSLMMVVLLERRRG
jgi:hypothetical protein